MSWDEYLEEDRYDFTNDWQDYEEDDMQVQDVRGMFNFQFEKSSDDIKGAAAKKVTALKAKITEREQRITSARKEYKIDDAAMNSILRQARKALQESTSMVSNYLVPVSNNGKLTEDTITIGAGVVNMLLTEGDFIDGERSQLTKLEMIIRNLTDLPDNIGKLRGHKLSYAELEFLGF